jgi:pyruvate kinase
MNPRTKIICTIGPAVASFEKMVALIEAGMSVARLNFSHGVYEDHARNIENLKKAREKMGRPLAIMLDTQGPEIRIGKIQDGVIPVAPKKRLKLALHGDGIETIPFNSPEVLAVLTPGTKVLFDDGYILAEVVEKGSDFAVVEIQNTGLLKSGKKMNVPGVHLPIPAMTPKDMEDLRFGCKQGIDYIAASFISSSHHVLAIKDLLFKEGKPGILVIAKIESAQGVQNFDQIVQVADGIMIARGDLGVELDLEEVPRLQKMMIRRCYQACKPSITATQMLESMIANPRPTRAEASDVANAIYDSTSCIMLSGETAVGKYPIEAVQRMRSIASVAEADFNFSAFFEQHSQRDYHDVSSAVALAAVKTAYSANAKAIFAFSTSGMTARFVSRLRPEMPIIAVTPSPAVYHQMALNWGVVPVLVEGCANTKEAFSAASSFALARGLISFGDLVVVTAGAPFGKKGTTNMMMVENIGEVLVRGHKGFGPKVSGKISLVLAPEGKNPEELERRLVVIPHCDNTFLPVLKHAAGVILQNYIGDAASEKYAALIAKTFEISVMTRADGAMTILKEDEEVTLDPQRGLIYRGIEESYACPVLSM